MKTILLIDHYVPEPDRDAGSRAVISYMTALRKLGYQVVFRPYDGKPGSAKDRAFFSAQGIEIITGPMPVFLWWHWRNQHRIDIIIYSRPHVHRACHLFLKHFARRPSVYFGHDLHFKRMREQAVLTGDVALLAGAASVETLERCAWRSTDLTVYPSQEEVDLVQEMDAGIHVVTAPLYCFDEFHQADQAPAGQKIIFVAGFAHPPNIDAACWFVGQVWPALVSRFVDARLFLIGSKPSDDVLKLASDTVTVTGFVPEADLVAHYRTARIAVVPLRFGAGVKLKVVEAMQLGVPLVTTPVGSQGLDGLEEIAPVIDQPEDLAEAISLLLEDDTRWMRQMKAQSEFVRARFSLDVLTASIRQSFAEAGLPSA